MHHFDQNLVFLVVLVIVGIVRAFSNLAEKAREKQARRKSGTAAAPRAENLPRVGPKTNEERVRELLEALGQPTSAPPPGRAKPRTDIPARPLAPIHPPPSMQPFPTGPRKAPKRPRPVIVPDKPVQPAPPTVFRSPEPASLPRAESPGAWLAEEIRQQKMVDASRGSPIPRLEGSRDEPESGWRRALKTPEALRNAIILREIFGPPRAWQE